VREHWWNVSERQLEECERQLVECYLALVECHIALVECKHWWNADENFLKYKIGSRGQGDSLAFNKLSIPIPRPQSSLSLSDTILYFFLVRRIFHD
jgi:hypothetical protein